MEVDLSQGLVAIVDDDDRELVSGYSWTPRQGANTCYAYTNIPHPSGGGRQTKLYMHRLILGLAHGDPRQGDHIDGNGLNNRRSNLRFATRSQNQLNRVGVDRTSTYKGVSKNHSGWRARIYLDRTEHYLGTFPTEQEAVAAYDSAASRIHGEFARPNFPQGGTCQT